MRERYFWAAIALIAMSWVINSLYAQSKQLKEPVFLDHYIETAMDDHNYITFYYLANKNDRTRISYVELGELHGYPQNVNFIMDHSPTNIDTYTHHVLRSVTVQLHDFGVGRSDALTFDELTAYFADGVKTTRIISSIGEVIIFPERYSILDESNALETPSAGSSNDGSSWVTFQANEPLIIEEVSFPFDESIANRFTFSVKGKQNHTSLDALDLPIQMKKDGHLTFEIQLRDRNFVNPFEFAVPISGKTEQGNPFTRYVMYHSYPYLTQEDVDRIIQEKTGRDSGE
jgi:hypothetical protein